MTLEVWVNVDGAVLTVQPDGTGITRSPHGTHGWVSLENMKIVRASPFWARRNERLSV